MTLSTRVARNTIIQLAGKAVSTILGLAAIFIITRYLGQEGFGQYTIVITFLSFFGIIADLGLTLVTSQMLSQPGADQDKILGNLFTIRFISAIIFLGLGPVAIIFFPYSDIIKQSAVIAAFSFFFVALNQVYTGLFQKELRMDKISLSEVYGRIALLISVAAAVYLKTGLLGIIFAMSLSSAVNFLFNFLFARKFARIRFAFDADIWRDIAGKSWPLAITIFFNLLYLKADTLILSLYKTTAEVGIYGAAYRVIDILITVPFMFAGLILPIMSARWTDKKISGFRNVFQKSFDAMAIIALPMLVGTQFVAEKTMILVAGPEFAVSGAVLKVLVGAAALIFLGTILSHAVIAINEQKKLIIGYVFTSLTALTGYFIFIPEYSYYGAAWMTIYSELAIALFTFYLFWKSTRIIPHPGAFLKSLAASLAMAGALYAVSAYNGSLPVLLTVGATAYFAVLYLLKGMVSISFKEVFSLQKKQ